MSFKSHRYLRAIVLTALSGGAAIAFSYWNRLGSMIALGIALALGVAFFIVVELPE